jgi:membrane protease YdiL (CAAX protease family)
MTTRSSSDRIPRVLELTLFVAAMLWAAGASSVAGRAAAGIAGRLRLTYGQDLLESLFLLFLAVIGFQALDFIATKGVHRSEVLALPVRKTAGREWGSGFAIGWGLCLAAVLPALLMGDFHAVLNKGPGVLPGILAAIATLVVVCLAEEVIFRGYAFRRLVQGMGPAWASVVMSGIFAVVLLGNNPPRSVGWGLADGFLFGVVLAMCYLRTHGLWVGWGLHFGYRVMMAVVLGLPIVGRSDFGSLMDGNASGPRWLSGGGFGLDAAAWTVAVMLAGMVLVYRVTKDWAWAYTLPEIVPAGYEVVVAPPAAHVAMEKAAAPPPPLVQIMPVTSQTFSVRDEVGPKD